MNLHAALTPVVNSLRVISDSHDLAYVGANCDPKEVHTLPMSASLVYVTGDMTDRKSVV